MNEMLALKPVMSAVCEIASAPERAINQAPWRKDAPKVSFGEKRNRTLHIEQSSTSQKQRTIFQVGAISIGSMPTFPITINQM